MSCTINEGSIHRLCKSEIDSDVSWLSLGPTIIVPIEPIHGLVGWGDAVLFSMRIHGGSRWKDCNVDILLSDPDAMICDHKFALVFEMKLENT